MAEHERTSRKQYPSSHVRSLFDAIAPRYDFLNHFLSLGIDILWRRTVVSYLRRSPGMMILDVATGTGDLAFALQRLLPRMVVGTDIAPAMLERARRKAARRDVLASCVFVQSAAEHLPFPDNTFDAITVAFGIRNFSDLPLGLGECLRVLRPGGTFVALEFSMPDMPVVRQLYSLYLRSIVPRAGRLVSRHKEAYQYLNVTVEEFPRGDQVLGLLRERGFTGTAARSLTLGIAALYSAVKPG